MRDQRPSSKASRAHAVTELDDGSKRYDWSMQGLGRDEPEVARPAAKERVPLVRMTKFTV